MDKSTDRAAQNRKGQFLAVLVNPEAYAWLGLLAFGAAGTGWMLIGVGVFFALIPLFGLVAYWILRKQKDSRPNES
jgi:hypothetical protein